MVRRSRQPPDHVLELGLVADGELDRLQITQAPNLRLQHRPHRRDDDPQRAVDRAVTGMRQPSQHRKAAADGVAARRESLVRKGLPGGEDGHRGGVEHAGQRLGQLFGLPGGRRDGQDRASGIGQPLEDERPQGGRPGEVQRPLGSLTGVLQGPGEHCLAEDQVGEAGQAQRRTPCHAPCGAPRTPGRAPRIGTDGGAGGRSLRCRHDRTRPDQRTSDPTGGLG